MEINGTSAGDTITGTSRNDVINGGGGGLERLYGGGGNDVIGYDFFRSVELDGGADNDTVRFDRIPGGLTPQSVTVDLLNGRITESAVGVGTFGLDATNFENVDFSGSTFTTTLIGTTAANTLIGGSAADTITGGLGADTLTGGGAADSFVWNTKQEGGDTITDFMAGEDKLVFTAAAFAVDGAFDYRIFQAVGSIGDITEIDILTVGAVLNTAADVRAYLDTQTTTADHGMFVVANNALSKTVLYYTSNATDGVAGNEVFQIADLSTGSNLSLSDFVFI